MQVIAVLNQKGGSGKTRRGSKLGNTFDAEARVNS